MSSKPVFRTISFAELIAGDATAISTLHAAAIEEGFFYLNLTNVPNSEILQDVATLTSTSKALFDLTLSEKMLFDTNKLGSLKNYGYKPMGRNTGVNQGGRDGHELFLIPRDVLFGLNNCGRLESPETLQSNVCILRRFAEKSHHICLVILRTLELSTGLKGMVDCHRKSYSSTSAIALLKYPQLEDDDSFAGHIPHTDVGSLTLLFCEQDGLQAMHPASGKWEDVTPRPGHAIVNIGDSLHHLSQRMMKSAFHRVLPCTRDSNGARFSTIYFMRPEQAATFTDENGKEWTSIDWHTRKFNAFRADSSLDVQRILDGRISRN